MLRGGFGPMSFGFTAEEMSDDLHCFPEKMREKSSLRTRIVDGPGNAASGARQANIALRADSIA